MQTKPKYRFSLVVTAEELRRGNNYIERKWFNLRDYEGFLDFYCAVHKYFYDRRCVEIGQLVYGSSEVPKIFEQYYIHRDGYIAGQLWDIMARSDEEIAMIEAYLGALGNRVEAENTADDLLSSAYKLFVARADCAADYARNQMEDKETLKGLPEVVIDSIDFDALGKALTKGMAEYNGYYFKVR